MGLRAKSLLAAACLLFAGPLLAEQSCFARVYSTDHMQVNPTQTVRRLSVRFEDIARDTSTTGEWADVTAWFKGDETVYSATLYCSISDGRRFCGVECDGGGATLTWRDSDTLLMKTEGFIVSGGCDGEGERERWVKDQGSGATVFRLNRAALADCPPLDAH